MVWHEWNLMRYYKKTQWNPKTLEKMRDAHEKLYHLLKKTGYLLSHDSLAAQYFPTLPQESREDWMKRNSGGGVWSEIKK